MKYFERTKCALIEVFILIRSLPLLVWVTFIWGPLWIGGSKYGSWKSCSRQLTSPVISIFQNNPHGIKTSVSSFIYGKIFKFDAETPHKCQPLFATGIWNHPQIYILQTCLSFEQRNPSTKCVGRIFILFLQIRKLRHRD